MNAACLVCEHWSFCNLVTDGCAGEGFTGLCGGHRPVTPAGPGLP